MKNKILYIALSLALNVSANDIIDSPVDYVFPLMGTDSNVELSNGNTYPAIARPWGMNFWTPQTGDMGNGWIYSYDECKIKGFKQTHQPSPWINDYGQFSIMPVSGRCAFDEQSRASWFSHKAEIVKPYYYQVFLADHNVVTELTTTSRAAIFRLTYNNPTENSLIVDAFDGGSCIKVIPEKNMIVGYSTKNSGGVPENFRNYFIIKSDRPFVNYYTVLDNNAGSDSEVEGGHVGCVLNFDTADSKIVTLKVASSFISWEQAERNLDEVKDKNFDEIAEEGREQWNDVLGKIKVYDSDKDALTVFYSCLYRSLLFPRTFYEYNEDGVAMHYSPYNGEIRPGYMFTDTGFWDTFRSLFPLLNLLYPSVNEKIQEGLVNAYKESGFLPEWASPGHRDCMIGNNSASIVADAYLKGLSGYDVNVLYEALLNGANNRHQTVRSTGRWGFDEYNKLGYVPSDIGINESAARTLEYAYDDWCIYKLGQKLGRPHSEIAVYADRALNYKNLFDKRYGLMNGKNSQGKFDENFNPFKWGGVFTEGNSWHYTWSVFHDIEGLINLMGGDKQFNAMLDSVFTLPPVFDESYYNAVIHEIREMQIVNMGQYAHGNQPIQHMIYLYNYSTEPWKCQYWIREVMKKLYRPSPDGYCGDEDNGQTSAWYVFSAMGFYSVCPGSGQYVIGAPYFDKMSLTLENGHAIEIDARGVSDENRYIKSITVDGKAYTKRFFNHAELMKCKKIHFEMSDKPVVSETHEADLPYSFSRELNK